MSNEEEQEKPQPRLYTPKEVAKMFGISEYALKGRRQRGQIEGTPMGNNMTAYTEEQIKKADLSPRKRGPKSRKKPEPQEEDREVEFALTAAC